MQSLSRGESVMQRLSLRSSWSSGGSRPSACHVDAAGPIALPAEGPGPGVHSICIRASVASHVRRRRSPGPGPARGGFRVCVHRTRQIGQTNLALIASSAVMVEPAKAISVPYMGYRFLFRGPEASDSVLQWKASSAYGASSGQSAFSPSTCSSR